MKTRFPVLVSGIAALVALTGCAPDDAEYFPRRRGGFRPPTGPVPQEDLGAAHAANADPLNFPPGYQTPSGSTSGYSAVNPSATPEPKPAPAPPPSPAPTPPPPPAPPKQPELQYATKVPGKPGWIRSPHDGKLLDATGFLRGEQVQDPQSGKIMLVP